MHVYAKHIEGGLTVTHAVRVASRRLPDVVYGFANERSASWFLASMREGMEKRERLLDEITALAVVEQVRPIESEHELEQAKQ
jgi:hypothetical protein